MSLIVVDVESDGPIPMRNSMVCFGAVVVEPTLSKTFYGQTRPISPNWNEAALAISGFSREEHKKFDKPEEVMFKFKLWLTANSIGRPIFISDNPAYDWQWINFYFHFYLDENPFGYSARRIGDLYCGMKMDMFAPWRHLRDTKSTHNPVDDAMGNAEVLLKLKEMGLKLPKK